MLCEFCKFLYIDIADVRRSQAMSNEPIPFPYRHSSRLYYADMRPTFLSMFKNVFLPQRIDSFRGGCQRMPADASGCQRMPADASGCQRMPAGLKRTPSGTLADGSVYQRMRDISYGAHTLLKIYARVTRPLAC